MSAFTPFRTFQQFLAVVLPFDTHDKRNVKTKISLIEEKKFLAIFTNLIVNLETIWFGDDVEVTANFWCG